MADNVEREEQQGAPAPDPIADRSLSGPILICSALLFLSLAWALYDEVIGDRPWKAYQQQFVQVYTHYLNQLGPKQAAAEKALRASPQFQELQQKLQAAEQQSAPRVAQIDQELAHIRAQLNAIKAPFQDVRARVASMTYDLEHTPEASRESMRQDIEEVKKGPFRVDMPGDNGAVQNVSFTADELEDRFNSLKAREAALTTERAEVTAPIRDITRQSNQYLADNLTGLSQQQIDGLIRKMSTFEIGIKQIHVEEAQLVDRCESCHLGIREPLELTAADMGGQQAFVSHPRKDLMAIHDPQRFGCTPCHNGNGPATSSVTRAHGQYEHWLWPLFAKENTEAGCVKCHVNDRILDGAPTLNRGRDLFSLKGCVGCHRHQEFDRDADALTNTQKDIQTIELRQHDSQVEIREEIAKGDNAETNEQAQAHYARAQYLKVQVSNMAAHLDALNQNEKYLLQDQKMVGPNLKDLKLKVRKEWIPVWLKDPQAFRPGTKMPHFRLTDDEIHALAAFVWQSALPGPPLAQQPRGDATHGKELFETRGCMACHSIGEGNARQGGDFAANLSRIGEKNNYDYVVRWVHNPRQRTRPYCAYEKRDLGPEDYARHGLPYVFDLDHSTCPNDGHQLQVQNMTVMPSLRLTDQDARDIATYLTSLKHPDATYPTDVSYMDDPQMAARGKDLVGRYGCSSCHEIAGLEDSARIGTELTKEGSKPIEQLDFGLFEHQARSEDWYTHKGFFEHKLRDPAFFDQGREKAPADKLKMPNIQLTDTDITALTTFLLGSLDIPTHDEFNMIPDQFRFVATDQWRDIQEGWWVIKKYNCMGCHRVEAGQEAVLSTLPRYQDPDWKEQLPPTLVQEGARVNPEWLMRFLANPALTEPSEGRNGVRTYLHARMPTFYFSPNEIGKLVRFFQAMVGQPGPYIPTKMKPLTDNERELARALFSSQAAPCLKCHMVGDPARDRFATAPNFLVAKERLKPAWTARWLTDPSAISPGTAMPSGLFRRDGDRWVFSGPTPPAFQSYTGDHVQLLVRYMFELTPDEQRRLLQRMPVTTGGAQRTAD